MKLGLQVDCWYYFGNVFCLIFIDFTHSLKCLFYPLRSVNASVAQMEKYGNPLVAKIISVSPTQPLSPLHNLAIRSSFAGVASLLICLITFFLPFYPCTLVYILYVVAPVTQNVLNLSRQLKQQGFHCGRRSVGLIPYHMLCDWGISSQINGKEIN